MFPQDLEDNLRRCVLKDHFPLVAIHINAVPRIICTNKLCDSASIIFVSFSSKLLARFTPHASHSKHHGFHIVRRWLATLHRRQHTTISSVSSGWIPVLLPPPLPTTHSSTEPKKIY